MGYQRRVHGEINKNMSESNRGIYNFNPQGQPVYVPHTFAPQQQMYPPQQCWGQDASRANPAQAPPQGGYPPNPQGGWTTAPPQQQGGQYYGQDCYAIGQQVGLSPQEVDHAYNQFSQQDTAGTGVIPANSLTQGNMLQSLLGGKMDMGTVIKYVTSLFSAGDKGHGASESGGFASMATSMISGLLTRDLDADDLAAISEGSRDIDWQEIAAADGEMDRGLTDHIPGLRKNKKGKKDKDKKGKKDKGKDKGKKDKDKKGKKDKGKDKKGKKDKKHKGDDSEDESEESETTTSKLPSAAGKCNFNEFLHLYGKLKQKQ